MKEVLLITGANGHLAGFVSKCLHKDYDVRLLTTKIASSTESAYFYWNIENGYIDPKALEGCKHIVHLAGFPILKRWSKKKIKK
jgi:nucleoside-diphosphate-sugar epimerase